MYSSVQDAYETNRTKRAYDSASDIELSGANKPGTSTPAEAPPNMGINGTLYVAPRPSNRIRLKEKRESSGSIKTNPFKATSPEKGANPYFERQTVNLQGQSQYQDYYRPSGTNKASDYIKNIRKIIGTEPKPEENTFGTYQDSILSEHLGLAEPDSTLRAKPRKLGKLNVEGLTVNDIANIVSQNKMSLHHQRSQLSSLASENDETMVFDNQQSMKKVHLNRKLINVLKNANNNLQQFNELMKCSPTRDKNQVVKEINKNIGKVLSRKRLRETTLSHRSSNSRSLDNFKLMGTIGLRK